MPIVIDARTATDHFPGIGRYVVNLSNELAQIAPDLRISLLYDPSAAATRLTLPDPRTAGLRRVACPVSPFSIRQHWAVPTQLRHMQATLYHSPYYLMPYLPGVPTVLTCYDLIPLIYPQYFTPTQRLIYRVAHLTALKTARVTLAISQVTKADLMHHFRLAPQQITVTPLAADTHFKPQLPEQIANIRRKYAVPEKYVLYFGSNKPHKNLMRLVRSFAELETKKQELGIHLVIAGHWDSRYPETKVRVEELGLKDQVVFAGPVDDADLPALYSGAVLFIFPSEYEGFGLPVLEAMACGTPVACSNTASLPEVAGDAALMFDPTSVDAIADALGRLLADDYLRAELRDRGLRQAARFTWQGTARKTARTYKELTA